jgi:hypothetical protein
VPVSSVEFAYRLGVAVAEWPAAKVRVVFDNIRSERRSGDVTAEIQVTHNERALREGVRVNLTSSRGRAEVVGYLEKRTTDTPIDWTSLFETACVRTLAAHREGTPAILLRDAERPTAPSWAIPPVVLGRHPTILFGDGGTAKSLTALAAALSIHTGLPLLGIKPTGTMRVAFLDFELDEWEHRSRMRGLLPPGYSEPDLVYRDCKQGSLSDQVDAIRDLVRRENIGFVVVDSIQVAADGPAEESDTARRFFQDLNKLAVGALLIAHVTKAAEGDQKPFGTGFWHNNARCTWFVKKQQDAGSGELSIAMFNRKVNVGPLAAPIGYRINWGPQIHYQRIGLHEVPEFAGDLKLKDRIAESLKSGAKSYIELGELLDTKPDVIRITSQRHEGKIFTRVHNTPDGIHRIALLARTNSPNIPTERSANSSEDPERTPGPLKGPVFGAALSVVAGDRA